MRAKDGSPDIDASSSAWLDAAKTSSKIAEKCSRDSPP